ncbi:hypothetical protein DA73_0400032860 [Tolypothrix bouteillei VB521301]|uniref:Uncharacterized protein n=1 Tax=Tolypothrix bouteillei VB521301 TaxID=1479485 RepID=A0A8S9TG49_9CYAN|nr:hypothetical protein DA73_0400032860 [Tolypothrix bouteillei VB521301]
MRTDYTGTFEAHITICAESRATLQLFQHICQQLNVKCVLIELPNGVTRSQPMTASYHRGTLTQVWTEVHNLAQRICLAGFQVTRVKIEAMPYNQDIPVTDNEVSQHPVTNYFEFHIKALLSQETDLEGLRQHCAKFGAHLSVNAFKLNASGQHHRFITLRVYGLGRRSAQARFQALLTSLRARHILLVQPQQEYTVYDSNLELDAGWLIHSPVETKGGEVNEAF